MKNSFRLPFIREWLIYVNDYGVCFGMVQVKAIGQNHKSGSHEIFIQPHDPPHMPVSTKNLILPEKGDLKLNREELQAKYGFETSKEDLAALLDGDPFDGET